ncbi:MAG: NAD-dependent deacylase [Anaerolineaceae bacterium]|nr:NAD-dependent deacylase [Anaerolineaceae bacterium]
MNADFDQIILHVSELIFEAKYIVALTGAGISTPSGIPDFRSQNTGLWEKNDPMRVASLSSFMNTPKVFFNWLKPLAKEIFYASPNPAHQALAILERNHKLKAIITQNIDNLHQKAGAKKVIEVHGSVSMLECLKCGLKTPFNELLMIDLFEKSKIPTCEQCHKFLKPSITLFEELLPIEAWESATHHCENADLVIVIGSSMEVYPANQLPLISLANGAKLIINTFSSTPLDQQADLLLPYDVVAVWSTIMKKLGLDFSN